VRGLEGDEDEDEHTMNEGGASQPCSYLVCNVLMHREIIDAMIKSMYVILTVACMYICTSGMIHTLMIDSMMSCV
jgi:hypothetical protein